MKDKTNQLFRGYIPYRISGPDPVIRQTREELEGWLMDEAQLTETVFDERYEKEISSINPFGIGDEYLGGSSAVEDSVVDLANGSTRPSACVALASLPIVFDVDELWSFDSGCPVEMVRCQGPTELTASTYQRPVCIHSTQPMDRIGLDSLYHCH